MGDYYLIILLQVLPNFLTHYVGGVLLKEQRNESFYFISLFPPASVFYHLHYLHKQYFRQCMSFIKNKRTNKTTNSTNSSEDSYAMSYRSSASLVLGSTGDLLKSKESLIVKEQFASKDSLVKDRSTHSSLDEEQEKREFEGDKKVDEYSSDMLDGDSIYENFEPQCRLRVKPCHKYASFDNSDINHDDDGDDVDCKEHSNDNSKEHSNESVSFTVETDDDREPIMEEPYDKYSNCSSNSRGEINEKLFDILQV